MRYARYPLLSAMISVSLVASSTAAVASSAPPAQPAEPDAWMALSMLSGAAALGTAGVTATQTEAPQPPLPPAYRDSSDTTLLMIGSTLILAVLLALAVSQGGDRNDDQALSPD